MPKHRFNRVDSWGLRREGHSCDARPVPIMGTGDNQRTVHQVSRLDAGSFIVLKRVRSRLPLTCAVD
jgi:hypothetical protein